MATSLILGIVLSLLLSAFFSGIEIAFVSANRLKVELRSQQETLVGRAIKKFSKNPSAFIGTCLLGNNLALVIYGMLMARLLAPWLSSFSPVWMSPEIWELLGQTLITTLIVLIFGEFWPKAIFRMLADRALSFFAVPFNLFYIILRPFVWILVGISKWFISMFKSDGEQGINELLSVHDLHQLVEQTADIDDEQIDIDTTIFENVLFMNDVKLRECLIPRMEIDAISIDASIAELKHMFIDSKHSRIPVYEESIDKMLGYVHHFDLLDNPKTIREILMPLPVMTETMPARDTLSIFKKERKNMALVVDEYGGTAGIITMEDLLEEIFGEIEDEYDTPDLVERQIAEDEYILAGRIEIDYLNEKYNLQFPAGEYETLSGFIIDQNEDIPRMNETIQINSFLFDILYVSNTKIETVKLKVLPKKSQDFLEPL